jgi:hypothetical protein
LLERASGLRLPFSLLMPVGFAVAIVAAQLPTLFDATAELATPLVVLLAVAGLALAPPWRREIEGWALACAVVVLAFYGAPIVLSGEATIGGYLKIEDTAIWLAITDHVMEHGRSVSNLEPSSYEAIIEETVGDTGYPIGVFLPLGVGRALVGQDAAGLLQPYFAFMAALLALVLYFILTRAIAEPRLRALAALISAQPALLFAFAFFGGIKELGAVPLIALAAALLPGALTGESSPRSLLPLAATAAALVGVLSVAGGVWLAPLLGAGLYVLVRLWGGRSALRRAGAFVVATCLLAIPSLVSASAFLDPASETLTEGSERGNLIGSLDVLQVFGIWPVGDFRLRPDAVGITYLLIALAAAAAVAGLVWAWRARAWEPLAYVGTSIAGGLMIAAIGSPWVDSKVFAIASPAFLLASGVGIASLLVVPRWRALALAAGAVIAGAVLYSNFLTYHDVDLAPHDRFAELQDVGERIDGEGPTLTTEYEYYGVRHFLRKGDPEGASLLRRRRVPLQIGQELDEAGVADIDEFQLSAIAQYRTLVLRRSPLASRPPAMYRLAWSGDYYEAWQRPPGRPGPILNHLSLGSFQNPALEPDCATLGLLAEEADRGATKAQPRAGRDTASPARGRLAFVTPPRTLTISLSEADRPESWEADQADPRAVIQRGAGTVRADIEIQEPGRYGIWLGGSFRGELDVFVDGRRIGGGRHELNYSPAVFLPFGSAALDSGNHQVELRFDGADWHPGSSGNAIPPFGDRPTRPFAVGPLVLGTGTADRPIRFVPTTSVRRLCARPLDWVEAFGASSGA